MDSRPVAQLVRALP